MTIGKMIEILKTKNPMVSIYNDSDVDYEWWVVEYGLYEFSSEAKELNLVDALWEAIKEVL